VSMLQARRPDSIQLDPQLSDESLLHAATKARESPSPTTLAMTPVHVAQHLAGISLRGMRWNAALEWFHQYREHVPGSQMSA
jgi:hypothetical protein